MSGLVKGIKKVFKKVIKVVKKIAPIVIAAAAIYFTGGLALSAFPATAGFAASMPLFAGGGAAGLGIGAGSVAGTGLFSQAASAIGLGGGLAGGAANAAMAAGGVQGLSAASAGLVNTYGPAVASKAAAGAMAGAGAATPFVGGTALAPSIAKALPAAANVAPGTPSAVSGASKPAAAGGQPAVDSALGVTGPPPPGGGVVPPPGGPGGEVLQQATKMTMTDKLLIASVGTQALGSLMGPDSEESAAEEAIQAKLWRGTVMGLNEDPSRSGVEGASIPYEDLAQGRTPSYPNVPASPMRAGKPAGMKPTGAQIGPDTMGPPGSPGTRIPAPGKVQPPRSRDLFAEVRGNRNAQ